MRKLSLIIFILLSISVFAQPAEKIIEQNNHIDSTKILEPTDSQPKINMIVTRLFTRYHYNRNKLNDSLSSIIFDNFLKSLDNNKLYFLKSDIEKFEPYRYQFDDYLYSGDLKAAFEIFNSYKKRLTERIKYALTRLETEFDFTIDEYIKPDRTEADWANSKAELDELWRKRLKNDALNSILSDKDWETTRSNLAKRYQRFHKVILQYHSEDVFQLYMNAFASALDPHTSYFSPQTSDNFKINMSLSLEGIGAQLTSRNDYTTVVRIIPGGPAAKSGLLHEEDRIVGVAQGKDGEMVDVIGWRIDDVVQLIRGRKGTLVRLSLLRAEASPDMPTEEIKLIRDKVKLEEQASKKEIIDIEEEGRKFKLGIISIPTFYIDFEGRRNGDKNYKSTTNDVRKLLAELKSEKVDGIIIDLRNNGGGSLEEAISLTGLFIKDGPVVQVKTTDGNIELDDDPDPLIVYKGPLAVFTNRFSASASEIFSGAIQDYGRGLILGEQTFGKGTVQNLIGLNRFMPTSREKLGQVKLTMAKFYRITGSSTQNKGVVPDVPFPSSIDPLKFGESSQPSALPWDQIRSSEFHKYNNFSKLTPLLITKHQKRMRSNPELKYLAEDLAEIKANREKNSFSLNKDKRKAERDKAEAKRKLRDEERQKNSDLKVVDKKEVTVKDIKTDDPLMEEAGHVLADLILHSIG